MGTRSLGSSLVLAAFALGCASAPPDARPTVDLTDAERTPDPSCTGPWIAAMTVRVRYAGASDSSFASFQVRPCLVHGPDRETTCVDGVRTNRYGWAVLSIPAPMRCVERAVLVAEPTEPLGYTPQPTYVVSGTAYQTLRLTPTGGVLDIEYPIRIEQLEHASRFQPLGDVTMPHTLDFPGNVTVTVIPAALTDLRDYQQLSITQRAPAYVVDHDVPTYTLGLGPDSEFSPDHTTGAGALSFPVTDPDGTVYDASFLVGTDSYEGTTHLEVGTMHPYATAVVTDHRVTVPLARIGRIALYRRGP